MPALGSGPVTVFAFRPPERPYRPGWVDALQALVERLPWPWWLTYLGAWLAVALVETLAKWANGAYPAGTLFPFHLVAFALVWYALAFMHLLDRHADAALDKFAPALELGPGDLDRLRYRLTTMPASGTLIATGVGVALGLAQRLAASSAELAVWRFAPSGWLFWYELALVPALGWGLIAVFGYHAVRQVRIVDRLYRHHVRVNLFDTAPLHAFASFSARLAVGILLICYAWLSAYPSGTSAPVARINLAMLGLASLLAVVTFLLPLWGAHQRLAAEKFSRKSDVSLRLAAVLSEQHARLDAREFAAMEGINEAVTGLSTELAILDRVSTWPWQASTLRGLLTAVFLPMFLWVAQQLLDRLL